MIIVLLFIHNISGAPNAQNEFNRVLTVGKVQSNLDYPDSLGLGSIVRIIVSPDNRKYEY